MNTRVQHWSIALYDLVEARRSVPFAWGVQDCCQFARCVLQVQTGDDPAKDWNLRPYKTARGALGNLRRLGGLENLPVRAGLAEIALPKAARGDIILVPTGDNDVALGVCLGQKSAAPGKRGLVFVPTLACVKAWRI